MCGENERERMTRTIWKEERDEEKWKRGGVSEGKRVVDGGKGSR